MPRTASHSCVLTGVDTVAFKQQQTVMVLCVFSLHIPSLVALPGFKQAVMSSQAHLLARANKTKATFPKLNLLLRLSSVDWGGFNLEVSRLASNTLTLLSVSE